MCVQSIVGVIISACMAGVIFAKLTIPKARKETILFSRNAVICKRNGSLYLMARITDMRKYSLLEAHVRLILIKKIITEEGEVLRFARKDLLISSELDNTENDRVFLLWPATVMHKIDEDSPFYEMDQVKMANTEYELMLVLEGTTQETGNTIQARTSYLPNEILWGFRFSEGTMDYDAKEDKYIIHHSSITMTERDMHTPRISAKALEESQDKDANVEVKY